MNKSKTEINVNKTDKKQKKINKENIKPDIEILDNKKKVAKSINKKRFDFKKLKSDFLTILESKAFQYCISLIGAILVVIEIIYCITCINMNIKYAKYTEKMEVLGFADLYDNGKATAHETVTKGEAIKLIIASIYNVNDINDFAYEPEFESKNAIWVTYAEKENIILLNEINKDNINSGIKYIDVLKYYTLAREQLMNKYLDITSILLQYKNTIKLKQDTKNYLAESIAANLIENNKNKFDQNNKMIKGEMNKLVVNFVNNFETITPKSVKIEKNKENIPSNVKDYPYIAEGIEKEIYEIPFYYGQKTAIYSPAELYKYRKEFLEQACQRLVNYYNVVLNIDYKTINVDDLKKSVNATLQYRNKDAEYEEYVKYIKDNKLVIKGKLTPLLPIVYVDGTHYRIRSKVEFEIVEGNTQASVIFGDLRLKDGVTYSNKKISCYIDAPMETSLTSHSMYPITSPIVKNKSGNVNDALLNIL